MPSLVHYGLNRLVNADLIQLNIEAVGYVYLKIESIIRRKRGLLTVQPWT